MVPRRQRAPHFRCPVAVVAVLLRTHPCFRLHQGRSHSCSPMPTRHREYAAKSRPPRARVISSTMLMARYVRTTKVDGTCVSPPSTRLLDSAPALPLPTMLAKADACQYAAAEGTVRTHPCSASLRLASTRVACVRNLANRADAVAY